MNHTEEWVAAIKQYFLSVAWWRHLACKERKETAVWQGPLAGSCDGPGGGVVEGGRLGRELIGKVTGEAA